MDGGGGAGEIVNLVDFDIEREADIVTHQFEARMGQQAMHVVTCARIEIVDAEDLMPIVQQALAQMRAEKARAAGHQDTLP